MSAINMSDLAEFAAFQRARGLSLRTIEARQETVLRCGSLDLSVIVEFLGTPGFSPATRSTFYASLNAYLKWLVLTEKLERNPLDRLPAPRRPRGVPRPLTEEQLVATLRTANRRRTRTMILLAAFAGLRVHEIAKLRGEDIDPWTRKLRVVGKGSKLAEIPLHTLLTEEAAQYPTRDWWFPSYPASRHTPTSPHVTSRAVSDVIRDAMRRAGVNATPHALRHTYGSGLLRAGIDIRVVQTLMRHESISSTQIYTLVDDDRQRVGIDALPVPAGVRS